MNSLKNLFKKLAPHKISIALAFVLIGGQAVLPLNRGGKKGLAWPGDPGGPGRFAGLNCLQLMLVQATVLTGREGPSGLEHQGR